MDRLLDRMAQARRAAALTGAGVSTLCGIPDFRGPQGLYKQAGAERIFDIDWFKRDPSIYYRGCRELIYGLRKLEAGPVHHALAKLEREGRLRGIITQNIDMLHQRAGSRKVIEIHGSPLLHRCMDCGGEADFDAICEQVARETVARCERCGGTYKPDITFFGEALPEEAMAEAVELAREADLMLVLGSSLTVQPAALLPLYTLQAGGEVVIINAQPTPLDGLATLCYPDLAAFAEAVLSAGAAQAGAEPST